MADEENSTRSWSAPGRPGRRPRSRWPRRGCRSRCSSGGQAGLQERHGRDPLHPLPRGGRRRGLEEAPLERPIIEEQRWMMTRRRPRSGPRLQEPPQPAHPHSYSVLRARFDAWFAEQAEEAGAFLIPETVVEELIVRDGRVVGVGTGREGRPLRRRRGGLRGHRAGQPPAREGRDQGSRSPEAAANQVAMAVKEVIALDPGADRGALQLRARRGVHHRMLRRLDDGHVRLHVHLHEQGHAISVGGGALLSEFNRLRCAAPTT